MMKAVQITGVNKLEVVNIPIPNADKDKVRIKVIACGICHTDAIVASGLFHKNFPLTPGHEVVGRIDQLGPDVKGDRFKIGELVSVGWFGGDHCGYCSECNDNQWVLCNDSKICGVSYNGGYAEYTVVPIDALAKLPNDYDPIEASVLGCAGVTCFNAIRKQKLKAGSLVAVQGVGGLGHLAIQYCHKLGYDVIALSSSASKEKLAKDLGAHHYIDSSKPKWQEEVSKLGSLKLIVSTAPDVTAINNAQYVLGKGGKLLILAPLGQNVSINTINLIANRSIEGSNSGDSRDIEETVHFSKINNVHPIIEKYTLEQSIEALKNINKAKFRSVIIF